MGHSGVEGGARSLAGALARLDVDGAGDERTEGAGDERTEELQLGDTPRRLSTLRYESSSPPANSPCPSTRSRRHHAGLRAIQCVGPSGAALEGAR